MTPGRRLARPAAGPPAAGLPAAPLASAALVALTLALLPAAGTSAAWNDGATMSAPGVAAVSVPRPVLGCVESRENAVVSWAPGALPGPGMPDVGYTARVADTGMPLAVDGKEKHSVTVTPAATLGSTKGDERTVEITATALFGRNIWTAVATQRVLLVADRLGSRVACG